MQYRPLATELLDDVASLLEDEVLNAVSGPLQHRVRVAANLTRIVQREIQFGPAGAAAERERLRGLLGNADGELSEVRGRLAARLRDPAPLSDSDQRAIYDALLATVRDDLAISKPGYDSLEADR